MQLKTLYLLRSHPGYQSHTVKLNTNYVTIGNKGNCVQNCSLLTLTILLRWLDAAFLGWIGYYKPKELSSEISWLVFPPWEECSVLHWWPVVRGVEILVTVCCSGVSIRGTIKVSSESSSVSLYFCFCIQDYFGCFHLYILSLGSFWHWALFKCH